MIKKKKGQKLSLNNCDWLAVISIYIISIYIEKNYKNKNQNIIRDYNTFVIPSAKKTTWNLAIAFLIKI